MELPAARQLALAMLRDHGLRAWTFRFDRARRRFGACHFDEHAVSLSRELTRLNDEAVVRDVVLHEIAHALAGPHAGHGPTWRRVADSLGVRAGRGAHSYDITLPQPRFTGTCPSCGALVRRHRRDRSACKRCCDRYNDGRFSRRYLLRWDDATLPARAAAPETLAG